MSIDFTLSDSQQELQKNAQGFAEGVLRPVTETDRQGGRRVGVVPRRPRGLPGDGSRRILSSCIGGLQRVPFELNLRYPLAQTGDPILDRDASTGVRGGTRSRKCGRRALGTSSCA